MLAKALATGDMLCDGRLTVGLGVGGRVEDYVAVGADSGSQTIREMAERVAVMKRVWAGEKVADSVLPVGPAPVQKAGPAPGRDSRTQDAPQRGQVGRRPGGDDHGSRRRQAERTVRRRALGVGRRR